MSLENRSPGKFGFTLNLLEKSASFNNIQYIKKGFELPVPGPLNL